MSLRICLCEAPNILQHLVFQMLTTQLSQWHQFHCTLCFNRFFSPAGEPNNWAKCNNWCNWDNWDTWHNSRNQSNSDIWWRSFSAAHKHCFAFLNCCNWFNCTSSSSCINGFLFGPITMFATIASFARKQAKHLKQVEAIETIEGRAALEAIEVEAFEAIDCLCESGAVEHPPECSVDCINCFNCFICFNCFNCLFQSNWKKRSNWMSVGICTCGAPIILQHLVFQLPKSGWGGGAPAGL